MFDWITIKGLIFLEGIGLAGLLLYLNHKLSGNVKRISTNQDLIVDFLNKK